MAFIAFIFGTVVGSFVNVLIYRLPKGISVVAPPSHCPACGHRLEPMDLVPLLSYLWLGRKCRYCRAPVSWRYFGVEALTGAVFALVYYRFGATVDAGLLCVLFACLIAAFFTDVDQYIIPDSLNAAGLIIGFARAVAGPDAFSTRWLSEPGVQPVTVLGALAGAAVLPGLLYLMILLGNVMFRRQIAEQESQWANEGILEEGERLDAMGMGDVKLAAVMGANLGIAGGLVALLTGVFIGAVFGLALKAMKRLEGHAIPFGPALIIGFSVSVFVGGDVIRWYLNLLAGG